MNDLGIVRYTFSHIESRFARSKIIIIIFLTCSGKKLASCPVNLIINIDIAKIKITDIIAGTTFVRSKMLIMYRAIFPFIFMLFNCFPRCLSLFQTLLSKVRIRFFPNTRRLCCASYKVKRCSISWRINQSYKILIAHIKSIIYRVKSAVVSDTVIYHVSILLAPDTVFFGINDHIHHELKLISCFFKSVI